MGLVGLVGAPYETWNNYCPPEIISKFLSVGLNSTSPTQLYSIIYFKPFSFWFESTILNNQMQHVSWWLLYVLCDVSSWRLHHKVLCDVLSWKIKYQKRKCWKCVYIFSLLTQFPHVSKSVLIVQPFESEHQSIQILIRTQLQSFNQLLHSFDDILQNFLDSNYNGPDCIYLVFP